MAGAALKFLYKACAAEKLFGSTKLVNKTLNATLFQLKYFSNLCIPKYTVLNCKGWSKLMRLHRLRLCNTGLSSSWSHCCRSRIYQSQSHNKEQIASMSILNNPPTVCLENHVCSQSRRSRSCFAIRLWLH
jgi:hypothetical protein